MIDSKAGYHSILEERVLNELRPRFERLGYAFETHPDAAALPAFLSGYVPDAIATRGDENVAIEVKGGAAPDDMRIGNLYDRFRGQRNWRLTVIFGDQELLSSPPIPIAGVDQIRRSLEEVEQLIEIGQVKAALVMGFAVLEATLELTRDSSSVSQPRKPGTVVQTLAMNGLIDRVTEEQLLTLVKHRNAIVHGHLESTVTPSDVRVLLSAVEKSLTAAFAA